MAKRIIANFLPLALCVSAFCVLVYVTVQQNYRSSADNPQIQIAEDISQELSSGKNVSEIVLPSKIDISNSIAPFVIIFDYEGLPLTSSATLHGKTPLPPAGVFDYVRVHGEDRISWQPETNVRSAIVITRYRGVLSGFVLAGRSLRETEKRENDLVQIIALVWTTTIIAIIIMLFFIENFLGKQNLNEKNI